MKLIFVNGISFARLLLVISFSIFAIINFYTDSSFYFYISMITLICSALTDLFDGLLARLLKAETHFGTLVDLSMDKLFSIIALPVILFISGAKKNNWITVTILGLTVTLLARDQWISFLRILAASYKVDIKPVLLGKIKTSINLIFICFLYYYTVISSVSCDKIIITISIAISFINLVTIWIYSVKYWKYIKASLSLKD